MSNFSNYTVSELQSDPWATVSAETTLSEIVRFQAIERGIGSYVVERNGRLSGFLALETIESLPRSLWATICAGDIMRRISELRQVSPASKLAAVVREIIANGSDRIPVLAGDRIVSVVSIDTIRCAAEKDPCAAAVWPRRASEGGLQ